MIDGPNVDTLKVEQVEIIRLMKEKNKKHAEKMELLSIYCENARRKSDM
jgi:hypothetical protein